MFIIKADKYSYLGGGREAVSDKGIFIEIEKGEPYESGFRVLLEQGKLLLCRTWNTIRADVSFSSPHISRRHAIISFNNGYFTISDLGSMHGTQINGCDIERNQLHSLRNGDKIGLAMGEAILKYVNIYEMESGYTADFTKAFTERADAATPEGLVINPERREVLVNG